MVIDEVGMKASDSRPAVSIAIDELRMTVDSLANAVGKLLDKVDPITAPDMDTAKPMDSPSTVDAKGNSPLTCELNNIGRSLTDLIKAVNYVARRIEL